MEKYIDQLIIDFHEAKRRVPTIEEWLFNHATPRPTTSEGEEGEGEIVFEGAIDPISISDLTGIETMYLPPDILLDAMQCDRITEQMSSLLQAYNIQLLFNTSVSSSVRYLSFRNFWETKVYYLRPLKTCFRICNDNCEDCYFGKSNYCESQNQAMYFDEPCWEEVLFENAECIPPTPPFDGERKAE